MTLEPWKAARFPNLVRSEYQVKSEETPEYNCIAWAAGDTSRWWWPVSPYYWPTEVSMEESLESFQIVFESIGYDECASDELEHGFEKVAIYVDTNGSPTHAAKQLENGSWTSKLGSSEDIEHSTLHALEGTGLAYASVALILRRPRTMIPT